MRVAAAFLALLVSAGLHAATLTLVGALPLPGVEGRIDHLSIDPAGRRLFVSALGGNSVEVIGLDSGTVLRHIAGFREPQGVLYVTGAGKLYVTNAGSGECDVLDGTTYAVLKRIELGDDADNLHYDEAARRMYVAAGSSLVVIDTADDRLNSTIALPGHPEGFVLERGGPRIFVNVPFPSRSVFVVDRLKAAVVGRWPVGGVNFPIALDEEGGLLFVAAREPASLHVVDTATGRNGGILQTDGDADDAWYDALRGRVFISCGAGFIDVFQQDPTRRLAAAGTVPTAAGGRTSLWVPDLRRLFVAVPRRGAHAAEIRVYAVE
jgi:DNA-binding beta-propeller fold protein YncE